MAWHLSHKHHGDRPWDVQVEAMRRAEGRAKYAWFLEQGLGKTALTLNDFIERNDTDLMLVLAPNSFKLDWKHAPGEWGLSSMPVGAWPKDPLNIKTDGVYAMNYESVRVGAEGGRLLLNLFEKRDVTLVIDESSAIKNPQSKQAKSVVELAKRAKVVRELNGTPITQNPMDYYAQLRCLGELNGMTPTMYRARFTVSGGFMGKQIMRELRNADELYSILDRCSFRALKKDWRDLPPKIQVPVHLEMTKRQLVHYREMMLDFFTIVEGMEVEAALVLTQMTKLRQISSCLLLQDGKAVHFEPAAQNPKMKALFEIMDSGPGKLIVVYTYRASGDQLYQACWDAGLQPAQIKRMEPEALMEEKRRFNEDPDCRILIAQQTAACRGHTLIGGEGNDRCARMVFYENSFSLLERLQMEDRIHRGDQDQGCTYFDLITSPMDQAVIDILASKQDLASAIDAVVAAVRQSVTCQRR